jgi:hypothetical protein
VSEDDNVSRSGERSGSYEVWFLTFTDPASGAGYWIRSTFLGSKKAGHSAGAWFARFDPADPAACFGIHRTSSEWTFDPNSFDVRVGGTAMRSGHAKGALEGGGHTVRWDLTYDTGRPTWQLLPSPFYRGSLAPTKPLSPNPDTRFTGTVEADGTTHRIEKAPGQQGHLYGKKHAERWAWMACTDFPDEEATIQIVTAKSRRGPVTTPYLTSAGVLWRGEWIRLVKFSRRRDFGLGTWRVDLENHRYRLTGRVEAPARSLIRARYEDPDGVPRYCHNSEIASCRLALFERKAGGFEEVALLESRGSTHAEWAGRTPAPQVEREFDEVGP